MDLASLAFSGSCPRPDLLKRRVPPEKRKRAETSCDRCRSRKQKCQKLAGDASCRYCRDLNVDCATTQPRKRRLVIGDAGVLSTRIMLLESLVSGLIPEADLSSPDRLQRLGVSLGIPMPGDAAEPRETSKTKVPGEERLLQDENGRTQYIGPASSYFFMTKLCTLFGPSQNYKERELCKTLGDRSSLEASSAESLSPGSINSPQSVLHGVHFQSEIWPDRTVMDTILDWFFDHVHADYPVFHEASFRETYEKSLSSDDGGTIRDVILSFSLLCILVLCARATSTPISDERERELWARAQLTLPTVQFTSSLPAVQALMIAALYLHNINRRDACWTLTGAAIRIAYAIGLHRDEIECAGSPSLRELRKRTWWTLYAFEQMQVSSLGRPSAIDSTIDVVGCPRESIMGIGAHNPPDYMSYANRLAVLLSRVGKTINDTSIASRVGPLSPTSIVLRDLSHWEQSLPSHLQARTIEILPPSFQRSTLLLHARYHYTVSLLTRYALLSHVVVVCRDTEKSTLQYVAPLSDICILSAQASCELLLRLGLIEKFDSLVWWDIFFLYSSALILTLSIIRDTVTGNEATVTKSKGLLEKAAALARYELKNKAMPGTMQRWANIILDLDHMADTFVQNFRTDSRQADTVQLPKNNSLLHERHTGVQDTYDVGLRQLYGEHHPSSIGEASGLYDRAGDPLQPFPDFVDGSWLQGIHWEDIGNMILGNDQLAQY